MRKDRRGIGGFMETMVAMMIVTITISAFMAVFAYTNLPEAEVPGISTDFLKDILVIDGEITGIDDSYVVEESERKGYRSMTVCIRSTGDLYDLELNIGTPTYGCDQIIENGIFMLEHDDGSRCAAVYEVVAFV